MDIAEASGYVASILVFLTFSMRTMIPLRIVGLCSNCAFITYGYLGGLYPVLFLHLILLPMNGFRLLQMVRLTREVRAAAHGDLNMEWLRPFATARHARSGDVLFNKGDAAGDMLVVVSGRYRLAETGIDIEPPQVVGEFALLAPERTRTQTLECVEGGTVLQVGYGQAEQLLFQNPKFGFYFLKLITHRLFQNIDRLEAELARFRQAQPA
jgi:hypothetical protein